ncbi:DUF7678 domain-containing protein [Dyadobacter sp. MSC1_007]|jgi:hypothetical protein
MVKQKVFRKHIQLTDFQIKRLYELSEFDGVDPAEHARRAIDAYLRSKKTDAPSADQLHIRTKIKDQSNDPQIEGAVWLSGTVNQYEFSVLILKVPAKTAMDKDRISKLSIWDPVVRKATNNFIAACIVNYDRGWDIRPSRRAEPYYHAVKALIDDYTATH